jgi:hypothetical protein
MRRGTIQITMVLLAVLMAWVSQAQNGGSTLILASEVEATPNQGPVNLAEGRTVSDIVMRHINVGDEFMGVSVVQRSKQEAPTAESGIAHVGLDEIYYIVAGEGTMVTGGEFVDMQTSNSDLLGPMERGEIRGGRCKK